MFADDNALRVFALPRLERVISGPGALARLPSEIERYECRRVAVVTGKTVGASPLAARVADLLGDRCAAPFTGARQHVPSGTVQALLQHMESVDADALVSVGGGSPIDTAKAAVHAMLQRRASPLPVHIAIPTTLSAGEFTDVAGITDEGSRVKHAVFDTRLAPRTVLADPEAARATPDWLWAASGMRALDHAIETLYAARRHPLSDTLAERAIGMLVEHLPPSLGGGADVLARRATCQLAAWLAVFGVTNAGFGLSHALGHQIGPRWNVPHGITSAIVLPHAMRFMAGVAPERFAPIAGALGVDLHRGTPREAALACADRVADFAARLSLPQRLRDAGVPADELDALVQIVGRIMAAAGAGSLTARPDFGSVLRAAY